MFLSCIPLLLLVPLPLIDSAVLYQYNSGLANLPDGVDQVQIAAYGDFNSDKQTDVFVTGRFLSENVYKYGIWCFFQDGSSFGRNDQVKLVTDTSIEQIVPGDFNHDGALDLLVLTQNTTFNASSPAYVMTLYYGSHSSYEASQIIPDMSSCHVLVLDYNNDLRLDLLGMNIYGERVVWINKAPDGNLVMTMEKQLPSDSPLFPHLAPFHSSAFTDVDGDCLSDLLIPTTNGTHIQLEIWINKKKPEMQYTRSMMLPEGVGAISIADVNGDGTLDLLFPVCYPRPSCHQEASIHIIYNIQKPMCDSVWSSSPSCRSQSSLCESDDAWYYGEQDKVIMNMNTWTSDVFTNDMTLRMGDIDLDGYPDILVTLMNLKTHNTYITILHNDACDNTCSSIANSWGRRTFSHYTYGTDGLESLYNATIASWLDIGNDGNLDILVTSNQITIPLYTYRNNYQVDAYFLTTQGSNGVCPAWCPSDAKFPSPKPYGVNHPGISIKLTVTDLSGSKSPRQGTQLSQSTYLALQTPYNLFGLGRTNNYIEEFYVGVPLTYSQHWMSWVAIIPNAQLMIFPWEPDTPSDWTLELFISPSSRLRWVIAAWMTCMTILVLTVAFFHWRERQVDREEIKRNELLFAF